MNGQPLDFSLEAENKLGEVVRGLERWLASFSMNIDQLVVDGEDLGLDRRSAWAERGLGMVNRIEIQTRSSYDQAAEVLTVLCDYMDSVNEALESDDRTRFQKLSADYTLIHRHLASVFPGLFGDDRPENILSRVASSTSYPDEATRERLVHFTGQLRILLYDRLLEIIQPEKEIPSAVAALRQEILRLENVSVLLQTGRDSEAMDGLVTFTELVEKLMRLFVNRRSKDPLVPIHRVEGRTFEEFTDEFNETLESLIDAFTKKDSVLIGDLLEYEVAPRSLRLVDYFPETGPETRGDGISASD